MELYLSDHAHLRAAQRNLSLHDIEKVMTWGREMYNAGALFYFLGVRDIPTTYRGDKRSRQLVGTMVVVCSHCQQFVITVYRNELALRRDRRKSKYDSRGGYRCSCCDHIIEILPESA